MVVTPSGFESVDGRTVPSRSVPLSRKSAVLGVPPASPYSPIPGCNDLSGNQHRLDLHTDPGANFGCVQRSKPALHSEKKRAILTACPKACLSSSAKSATTRYQLSAPSSPLR